MSKRNDYVEKALSWVGTKEGSKGHKQIVADYNKACDKGRKGDVNTAWCAMFVGAVAQETGNALSGNIGVPVDCSCGTGAHSLIEQAKACNVPIICAMGAGNKLDAGRLKVTDIYDTKVCPLARVMRRELKKRNIKKLKVVYSDELPIRPLEDMSISCRTNCICPPGAKHKCTERRDIPGSTAFVPAVAGLLIAGEIIKDLRMNKCINTEK